MSKDLNSILNRGPCIKIKNPKQESHKVAIVLPGFSGSTEQDYNNELMTLLSNNGFKAIGINYTTINNNEHEFYTTTTKEIENLKFMIDGLKDKGYSKFFLFGRCWGASIAILYTANYNTDNSIKALALKSPCSNLTYLINNSFPNWNREGITTKISADEVISRINPEFFSDALKIGESIYMQKINTPAIIFQGTEDTIVPAEHSERLKNVINANYITFKGEGHKLKESTNKQINSYTLDFFSEYSF